jgi:hypothetical protein
VCGLTVWCRLCDSPFCVASAVLFVFHFWPRPFLAGQVGLLGAIRFLAGYYLVFVKRRAIIGAIGNHRFYTIKVLLRLPGLLTCCACSLLAVMCMCMCMSMCMSMYKCVCIDRVMVGGECVSGVLVFFGTGRGDAVHQLQTC